jgi:hypothetical protein
MTQRSPLAGFSPSDTLKRLDGDAGVFRKLALVHPEHRLRAKDLLARQQESPQNPDDSSIARTY